MDILSPDSPGNNPPEKCCSICKQIFPATTEFWHRHKGRKDGLNTICKACGSAKEKARYKQPEVRARILAQKQEYQRRPDVRERINGYHRDRYKRPDVREKVLAHSMRPDVHVRKLAYYKDYNRRPETLDRQWIRQNRPEERVRKHAYHKAYTQRPEYRVQAKSYDRNRHARKMSVSGVSTSSQVREMLKRHHYRCYYCRAKLRKDSTYSSGYAFHIEHTFPLSRVAGTDIPANDINYLVPACPPCNSKKKDKFPWEFPEGGRLL